MTLKFRMLAHVTYAVTVRQFECLAETCTERAVLLARGVKTPQFKRQHLPHLPYEHDLLIVTEAYPTEYLALQNPLPSADESNSVAVLPSDTGGWPNALTLRSRSFEPATLSTLGSLFSLEPDTDHVEFRAPGTTLRLVLDESAPDFATDLDGGPGPVSLGIFCRGIDPVDLRVRHPDLDWAFEDVTTPAGLFMVGMVRVGELWLELLERRERYAH